MNKDGVTNLACAVVEQARKDFLLACCCKKFMDLKAIEKEIRSKEFGIFLMGIDPETVIKEWKKQGGIL